MIGVYKITNIVNKKSYIGISMDILQRWRTHVNNYQNELSTEYNKTLYMAMRKHGIVNFSFEIIELCSREQLKNREIFWIKKLDTFFTGYNETVGGDIGGFCNQEENHSRHKLTTAEVINIRTRYNNLERKNKVYEDYKDKINKTGFHKVWNGYTWKNIMPEVFNKTNIEYHKNDTSNNGIKNGRALLTEEDVKSIRLRRDSGEPIGNIYLDYSSKITKKYMYNVWNNYTWKHII